VVTACATRQSATCAANRAEFINGAQFIALHTACLPSQPQVQQITSARQGLLCVAMAGYRANPVDLANWLVCGACFWLLHLFFTAK
jgi:hypothetical protein